MNWAKEVALKIIEQRPNEEVYTIASGISPSGFIHIGNFREVATPYLIVKELKKLGKKVRYILSFDDFDRFRKVPGGIDPSYEQYIGLPYSAIPSPFDDGTYADYFEKRLTKELEAMDVEVEYIYQTIEYQKGRYKEHIKKAIDNKDKIFDILDEYRTQDAQPGEKEKYYPISIYCDVCGKDSTKITRYDQKNGDIDYVCACGHERTINIDTAKNIKLQWKVDWPMRWMVENVSFEQAGVDHNSANSSRPVSERVAKEIYNFEPPINITYNFIGIKGGGAKMSSSAGNVLTLTDLLKVYDKHLIWWFYAKYDPMSRFDIAFDSDVIRYYGEFDRWVKMYFEGKIDEKNKGIIESTGVTLEYLNNPSFNYMATFLPMVNYDIELLKELLRKENIDCESANFDSRLELTRHWVENYGTDHQVKLIDEPNEEIINSLNQMEKSWLEKTIQILNHNYSSSDDLQTDLYAVVKNDITDPDEIKIAQKRYFNILYQILLGSDKGPKMGLFLMALPKEQIISRITLKKN